MGMSPRKAGHASPCQARRCGPLDALRETWRDAFEISVSRRGHLRCATWARRLRAAWLDAKLDEEELTWQGKC